MMGVINASPESFFAGSVARLQEEVAAAARRAEEGGADVLDIGAMSTAPYRETWVSPEEERSRLVDAIAAAREASELPISADTQRASVAAAAVEAGAAIVNDVSGLLGDRAMGAVIAETGAGVVLMANDDPELEEGGRGPTELARDLLAAALERAARAGIPPERILLDPGFGFFRHRSFAWHEYDVEVLRAAPGLQAELGRPMLVGVSRKSFFSHTLGRKNAEDRLAGSLGVAAWCAQRGIGWLRVHDVRDTADVVRMVRMLENGGL